MVELLRLEGVSKVYDGQRVLDDASFDVFGAECLGIVGPNGSGKTTLARIITGHTQATSGTILLSGHPARFASPRDALASGIALVSQHDPLFEHLTVLENVVVGKEPFSSFLGVRIYNSREARRTGGALLEQVSSRPIPLDARVATLSGGQRKAVALARALGVRPQLLVLDEATNSLGLPEREGVYSLVRQERDRGTAILFISHDVASLRICCDRVIALADGATTPARRMADLADSDLALLMAGVRR